MVGLYCAVSGCKNNLAKCRSLGSNVTFHRFPIDPSLREIWTESCNREKDWNKPNVFMCSAHFSPSDFRSSSTETGQKRTHLVRGAVPSRNLPTSKYVCCAVGCNDAPPEIIVRRFPEDVTRRTELLGDVPRKQGIPVIDCYLCERHLVLKQFLKEEVEEIAKRKEEEAKGIVILEVSKVDGKQSTKLIEPQAKRRKVVFQSEDAETFEEPEVGVSKNTIRKIIKCEKCDVKTLKSKDIFTDGKKVRQVSLINPEGGLGISSPVSLASSDIGQGPLPILVKNGGTSQLMFLHRSPHLQSESVVTSNLQTGLNSDNSNSGKRVYDVSASENSPRSSSEPTNLKSTGDVLVDRLYRRIQELEEKIVTQRDRYKTKMTQVEDRYSSKVKELNSRVKELKSEVQSFNKMHKNIVRRGLVRPVIQSSPKPSRSISEDLQSILGHSFTNNQIKKLINESEPVRWSNSELLDAFTLKSLSYGAYTFVRNHLKYPLPSPKYLRRWLTKVEKERTANNLVADSDVQHSLGSESENESDEELDMLAAESGKTETPCGEIILEHPRSFFDEREIMEDEEVREDDLHDSKEILIIADPDNTCSSNIEGSNQTQEPENDFEVFYALDSSKEVLQSPKIYVLNRRKKKLQDGEQIEGVSCSENFSECEMKVESDNVESEIFEQVVIVEEAHEENSRGGEI